LNVGEDFQGWTEEALRFFVGLELDNSKPYFEANRAVYETQVRAPMLALLARLEPEFGPARKVFRPNRDIRFSADKSPYKTNIAAMAGDGGRGGYVSLSARGLYAGTGFYHPDKPVLDRFRDAVAGDSGGKLAVMIERLERAGYEVGGDSLKTVPRGYSKDHPRARLLMMKDLVVMRDFGLQPWLSTPEAAEKVAEVWRAGEPVSRWLSHHVG
jgi:uncharacterized protein (TIGR02453 family)